MSKERSETDYGLNDVIPIVSPTSMLAKFQRDIYISRIGYDHVVMHNLLKKYIDKVNQHRLLTYKDLTSQRANIRKELKRKKMTINVFVKALGIIGITDLKVTIHATGPDPSNQTKELTTEHSVAINIVNWFDKFMNHDDEEEGD